MKTDSNHDQDAPQKPQMPGLPDHLRCSLPGCVKPRWLSFDRCADHKPYPGPPEPSTRAMMQIVTE